MHLVQRRGLRLYIFSKSLEIINKMSIQNTLKIEIMLLRVRGIIIVHFGGKKAFVNDAATSLGFQSGGCVHPFCQSI